MYFRRFDDEALAQASYLIGCQASGVALVIDPAREVAPYLRIADAEGLRIVAVTETHIHADFVSGLRELAAATGARAYLSGCGPAEWQYRFRHDANTTILHDGDRIEIGKITVTAVHTPGHTPEHLAFLVTDGAATAEPMGILTGDFVFVGDVGRPDLLEKAAHVAKTAELSARQLWKSLAWFRTLPDHLQVWPGHGAGSACGKGLGAVPQSTVGYEKRVNWAFDAGSEDDFVRQVLAGQPEPPAYFGRMKQVNRDGPPVLGALAPLTQLGSDKIEQVLAAGVVVDVRPTALFAAGHLPGTLNVPMGKSFPTYAGSVVPYDQELFWILPDRDPAAVQALGRALRSIGFDRIGGVFGPDVFDAWLPAGKTLATTEQVTADQLRAAPKSRLVIDVRNRSEWDAGHIAGARLVPLPELVSRLAEIPTDTEIVLQCQGGGRSAIAASVLKRAGHARVANLSGGFSAWVAGGGPVER